MESRGGFLGVRVDPKEVLQNFLGVSYLLRGIKPSDPPLNTALVVTNRTVNSKHLVKSTLL